MNAPAWEALEQLREALGKAQLESDRLREEATAWQRFSSDARVRVRHMRVYRWCRTTLGDTPIAPKLQTIADDVTLANGKKIGAGDVSNAISGLVRMGYLIEHPRGTYNERYLTLRRFVNSLNTGSAVGTVSAA